MQTPKKFTTYSVIIRRVNRPVKLRHPSSIPASAVAIWAQCRHLDIVVRHYIHPCTRTLAIFYYIARGVSRDAGESSQHIDDDDVASVFHGSPHTQGQSRVNGDQVDATRTTQIREFLASSLYSFKLGPVWWCIYRQ